jgi:hypothetical protein
MKSVFKKILAIAFILVASFVFLTQWLESNLKAPENVVILNKVERAFESDPVITDWKKRENKYLGVKWMFFTGEIHGILQFKKETKIPDNVCKRLVIISKENSNSNFTIKFDKKVIGD